MRSELVIERLGEKGLRVFALASDAVRIGRAGTSEIVIQDPLASKSHAEIGLHEGRYLLRDLGSHNGTFVNGRRVDTRVLAPGDVIRIGKTRLRFAPGEMTAVAPHRPASGSDSGSTDTVQALPVDRLLPLVELGRTLATAEGDLGALDGAAELLRAAVPCERVRIVIVEEGTLHPLLQACASGGRSGGDTPPDAGAGTEVPTPLSAATVAAAIAAEAPVRVVAAAGSTVADGLVGPVMLIPLRTRAARLGFIAFERRPDDDAFTVGSERLASIAAAHLTTFLRYAL